MKASLEKILFWNEISRKKYSLEKQLEINHTAGSVLPNAREWDFRNHLELEAAQPKHGRG